MSSSRRSARLSAASSIQDEVTNASAPPKQSNTSKKRKAVPGEATGSKTDGTDGAPSTPKRKKTVNPIVSPFTPTPSAIGLMTAATRPGDMLPPPINRLAVPNGTNATLVTPETHRVVAPKPLDEASPSKKSNVRTTATLLEDALAHIVKVEPQLLPIIGKHHCQPFSPAGLAEEIDPFNSLVSSIISQQVSGAAAKSIKAKFVALFNPGTEDTSLHKFPTPSQVSESKVEIIRTAGLSGRKAEYVHGLAEKFHTKEITTQMLLTATDEELLEELVKVRGLGKWSVEMFSCFALKRMDVFSTGDLGVQRGMAAFKGRDVSKLKNGKGKWKFMSEKEMEETAEKFRPYRSVFMWYMWRVEDVDISAFDN